MMDVLQETREADADFAAELRALLEEYEEKAQEHAAASGTSYQAALEGDGAIAQGEGATAAGKRGVAIGGDAHGPIVIGDNSEVEKK
jgi:ATP phosphoribosyltransferase regulatory subunit HisZ